MPNHASTSLCHPVETRALSINEYARIQEFPEGWTFQGTTSEQYAQVGNAVPTRLGKIAGNVIAQSLDTKSPLAESAPHAKNNGVPKIVYVQSHVRTRQWFKNGEVVVWDDGKDNSRATYGKPKTLKKIKGL